MTSEWWQRVEEVFEDARTRPAQERAAFLDESCGDDSALRQEVEALLAADDHPSGAFDGVVSKVAADWANDGTPSLVGQQIGRYQILEPLGSGGMGEVYLALDPTLERKVALKLLPAAFTQDRDRLRRFEQEARAASALNHPSIITIYEIGRLGGRALHRDRVHRRRDAARTNGSAAPSAFRHFGHRLSNRGRARRRAPGGHRPSRHQAGQHHAPHGWLHQSARFRSGQTREQEFPAGADRSRARHGHDQLHVARAGPGSAVGSSHRYLQPRRRPL